MLIFSLESSLAFWETVEYISEAVVFVGCLGEFLGEFTNFLGGRDSHRRRDAVLKLSTIVLLAGLAIELGSLIRTNGLSGLMIADLNKKAEDARRDASNAQLLADEANAKAEGSATDAAALRRDAESLRKQAEDERLARIKIEEAVAWRSLTKSQQSEISKRLMSFAGEVALPQYDANEVEEYSFALDIASALHQANWRVFEPLAVLSMREGPVPVGTNPPLETGVVIKSTGDKASRDAASALSQELVVRGFDSRVSPDIDKRSIPEVFVILEHRPEGAQGEAKLRKQKAKTQRK
jgi:hypothetical protein